ncbi:hypothetical protein [Euzebya tangerina]|uniref:hypothetical protein n=1 Tax=Euzebya tangerina TaxID=591198 RepID=UPI00196A8B0B|nr:hypothetical protein [Euzebya tangerina]
MFEQLIDVSLARRLRDAGLIWRPAEADQFVIPDRLLDDELFTISHMTVQQRQTPAGPVIAFNGTPEWALDAIEHGEVIWLPREDQLRDRLAARFVSLTLLGDGTWRCVTSDGEEQHSFDAEQAVDAYGLATLHHLLQATEELFDSI